MTDSPAANLRRQRPAEVVEERVELRELREVADLLGDAAYATVGGKVTFTRTLTVSIVDRALEKI